MRRWCLATGVAALAVGMTGCWGAPGQNPDRNAFNPFETGITVNNVASLDEAWTADLETVSSGVGPPIVSSVGLVHAISDVGIWGIDSGTGHTTWEQPTFASLRFDAQVHGSGSQGLLFSAWYGSSNHILRTFSADPATGEYRDLGTYPGRVEGLRGGRALLFNPDACCQYQEFAVLDLESGQYRAGVVHIGPPNLDNHMTLGETLVFHSGVGLSPGVPGTNGKSNGVRAYPPVLEDRSCGDPFFRMPCPVWAAPTDGTTATSPVLSADQTTVFVGTDAGTFYAVDAANGAVRWTAALGSALRLPPALANGSLYVPTSSGSMVVLDADGCGTPVCAPLWSTTGTSELTVQPAVAGKAGDAIVVTGAADGTVAAYDAAGCGAASCEPLWSAGTGSRITGAPAVSLGRVFVGTQDGRLVTYAPT